MAGICASCLGDTEEQGGSQGPSPCCGCGCCCVCGVGSHHHHHHHHRNTDLSWASTKSKQTQPLVGLPGTSGSEWQNRVSIMRRTVAPDPNNNGDGNRGTSEHHRSLSHVSYHHSQPTSGAGNSSNASGTAHIPLLSPPPLPAVVPLCGRKRRRRRREEVASNGCACRPGVSCASPRGRCRARRRSFATLCPGQAESVPPRVVGVWFRCAAAVVVVHCVCAMRRWETRPHNSHSRMRETKKNEQGRKQRGLCFLSVWAAWHYSVCPMVHHGISLRNGRESEEG